MVFSILIHKQCSFTYKLNYCVIKLRIKCVSLNVTMDHEIDGMFIELTKVYLTPMTVEVTNIHSNANELSKQSLKYIVVVVLLYYLLQYEMLLI